MDNILQPIDGKYLHPSEKYLIFEDGENAKIYDEKKTKDCSIGLTNLRLIIDINNNFFQIPLYMVSSVDFKKKTLTTKGCIRIKIENYNINILLDDKIKENFYNILVDSLRMKSWKIQDKNTIEICSKSFGIASIEKEKDEFHQNSQIIISESFKDITTLMAEVKNVVALSESLSTKLKNKNISMNDDEISKLRSTLLDMGIDDPVLKTSFSSDTKYYIELAKEIHKFLEPILKDHGNMMTLADIYCRINRARGIKLLSPNDLLEGCKAINKIENRKMELKRYSSGSYYITTFDEKATKNAVFEILKEEECISSVMLSKALKISSVLAHEQLLHLENNGAICRDESIFGVKFYENLFL